MTGPDRNESLARARQGDAAAREALLDGYRPYVRVLVRGLRRGALPQRFDDDDLIQDALLAAHRHFAVFRGVTTAELTGWLRQIVLRVVRHALRDNLDAGRRTASRERPLDEEPVDLAATPAEEAVRADQAARLAAALQRLPEDMQVVLLGRHIEDESYATLAERLGRSEGAVRVLYTRALRRLREVCGGSG